MRLLKLTGFAIALLVFGASCSKNNDQFLNERGYHKSAATDFLDDFYDPLDHDFGDSITTTDGGVTHTVVEVFVDGASTSRGFVAYNSSGTFVYFADVNRSTDVLTMEDIGAETSEHLAEIDTMWEYNNFDDMDIMEVVEHMNNNPSVAAKRKFMGNKKLDDNYPCIGGSKQTLYQNYFFWIKNGPPHNGKPEPC